MNEVTVQEFSNIWKDNETILLDVRTVEEFSFCNLGGTNIPLNDLERKINILPKDKEIYCLCHHGVRSRYAQAFLLENGYSKVYNISGGIDAWSIQVDSSVKRY